MQSTQLHVVHPHVEFVQPDTGEEEAHALVAFPGQGSHLQSVQPHVVHPHVEFVQPETGEGSQHGLGSILLFITKSLFYLNLDRFLCFMMDSVK